MKKGRPCGLPFALPKQHLFGNGAFNSGSGIGSSAFNGFSGIGSSAFNGFGGVSSSAFNGFGGIGSNAFNGFGGVSSNAFGSFHGRGHLFHHGFHGRGRLLNCRGSCFFFLATGNQGRGQHAGQNQITQFHRKSPEFRRVRRHPHPRRLCGRK